MTTTPKHSPILWTVQSDTQVLDARGMQVCNTMPSALLVSRARSYSDEVHGVHKANAAFIVLAVNSLGVLLEATKALLSAIDAERFEARPLPAPVAARLNTAVRMSRAAIAAAERKTPDGRRSTWDQS